MAKDYQIILLEEIRDQNKALLEGQKDQATRADIHRLEQRLDVLEGDLKVVKTAVTDMNDDIADLRRQSGYARWVCAA